MRYGRVFLLFLILVLAFVLRVPFFNRPLDYDEGIYAFSAFFSRGDKFFSSLPLLKLPGTVFTYRLLDSLFPGQIAAFRIAAALLAVLATFGVYKLGRLLHSWEAGIFSALIFALFSSQISLDSPANTEFFMVPFTVFAFCLFWIFLGKRKRLYLALSGLSAGIAVFYKQVAVFEVALLGLWLVIENLEWGRVRAKSLAKQWLIFGISFSTPLLVSLLFFSLRSELSDFWQLSFGVGAPYIANAWSGLDWIDRFNKAAQSLWHDFWPFWLAGFGGLAATLIKRERKTVFLLAWTMLALIGALFNGWFFAHYFIQLIPPVSLLGGFFIVEVFKQARSRSPHKNWAYPLSLVAVLILPFLTVRNRTSYYLAYLRMLRGDTSRIEYLEKIGTDVGGDGWLSFYEASDYLKRTMEKNDTLFVWGTSPLPYYLARRYPTTSFVRNHSLLDYNFLLPTYHGWSFDFEANRRKLMEELFVSFPTFIFIRVSPEQIFDQMFLFGDFSRFVSQNYQFEKKFGNILVYRKVKEELKLGEDEVVPLEIVERFAAITGIEEGEEQTAITFEPMVNPGGILRSFKVIYPEPVGIDFEPLAVEFFGLTAHEQDLVGGIIFEMQGGVDLHIKFKGVEKPISFVRLKMDDVTWNNRIYGVNRPLKVNQEGGVLDIYLSPPLNWQGKVFEVYIIYEDGGLSRQDFSL